MRRFVKLMAVAAAAVAGCGQPDKVATHPVRGQVYYDGQPAAGVQVFLVPVAAPMVPDIPTNPHGTTGADGRFTIGTYSTDDGAAEGSYQVVLYWPEEVGEGEESTKDRLLGWYTAARSKLTVIVPAGGVEISPYKLPAMKTPPAETSTGIPGRN
jgi:5-hydroxyisourate hydrolase-like protein (transthyretin family)